MYPRHICRRRRALIVAATAVLSLSIPTGATPVSWAVDADGQWTSPSNWSTGSLPAPGDDVTLDRPLGSYTISLTFGSQAVRSLFANENLSISGGTLSLSAPSTVNGPLSLTGGTLSTTSPLILTGPASLTSGAQLFGTLSLANTATLSVAAGTLPAASAFVGPGAVTFVASAGTSTVSGSYSVGATTLLAGSKVAFNSPVTVAGALDLAGSPTQFNTVSASFAAPVSAGSISLASANATFSSSVTTGPLSITRSDATFNGPLSVSSLYVRSRTMTIAADVTSTGPVTWAGGRLAGAGRLVIPANGFLTIDGDTALATTIDNYGTATFGPTATTFEGATLNNHAGATLTLLSSSTVYNIAKATPNTLNNAGSLLKSGTGGVTLYVPVTNTGTINVDAGTLNIGGSLSNTGALSVSPGATASVTGSVTGLADVVLSAGTWSVADDATLSLPTASIATLGPAASVTLAGPNSRFNALHALTTNRGSLTLTDGRSFATESSLTNNGTLTVGPAASLTVNGALLNTGALALAGTVTLVNSLFWDYTGPSPIGTVRQYLHDARLVSPSADATHRLAYLDDTDPMGPATVITLIALTGDTDFDGRLDADDYAILDRSYARSTTNANWIDGDIDYDGVIDQSDYLLIDTALAHQQSGSLSPDLLARRESQFGPGYVAELVASVPEPASMSLLALMVVGMQRRRRS